MVIKEIKVPDGIKYISEWKDFTFPPESCLIDKQICGCGFTEWCLNNTTPVILCSPRKVLLENKTEQHNRPGSVLRPVYYFKNERDESIEFDNGIEEVKQQTGNNINNTNSIIELERRFKTASKKVDNSQVDYISLLKTDLCNWVISQTATNTNFIPKILVTYDSLKYVVDALGNMLSNFVIIIDEFQSIFSDSTFKSDVELGVIEVLSTLSNKIIFVSATPMLERYLDKLPYFSNMIIYKLIWNNLLIEPIRIDRKYSNSIRNDIAEIILKYKSGIFPVKITQDGVIHESKEAVFFVNSVNYIIDVIKKTGLQPNEVNILCSNTLTNQKKLGKIGHSVGKVPINIQDNKMFTFCTRTTYIGADFYSDCAMTFIFSDLNKQSLTLDISLDLPQIVGRQRLDSNVFRNEIVFYYHLRNDSFFMTKEDFDKYQTEKENKTQNFLQQFSSSSDPLFAEMIKSHIKSKRYESDYVGFSKKQNKPVENVLVKLAELRAWEITRPDYQEKVLIKKTSNDTLPSNYSIISSDINTENVMCPVMSLILEFKTKFESTSEFSEKMKIFSKFLTDNPGLYEKYSNQFINFIPVEYRNYLNKVGIDRIKALNYKKTAINNEISYIKSRESGELSSELMKTFQIGKVYSRQNAKELLSNIYKKLGFTNIAKATDLLNFLLLEECTWVGEDKKRIHGFKVISYK